MDRFGVDYSWGRPGVAALHAAGATFACRYASRDPSGKNLTTAEAALLSAAGIDVVLVWEDGKTRALAGRAAGAADAREALRQAEACGMPPGRPIYFAVDFDATPAQMPAVLAYLDGCADAIGAGRVGVYGGLAVVRAALDGGHATWAWQTYAWSGTPTVWDGRAVLRQYSNGHKINGAGVDYDTAVWHDFGQWKAGQVMPKLWMPGAERRPEGNGGSMVGGPPRAVWHITWDKLGPGGKMPSFNAIASYLKSVNYAPHLMWDPWTGRTVQFYPADQSARALANAAGGVETNRMGSHCVQVEVFFSPGAVVGGKTYKTVADTPCKGLPEIVAWMRSLGIPDAWPAGWPQWTGNPRSVNLWRTRAGHFGHSNVPENDHTDPGPMPKDMFGPDWMEVMVNKLPTLAKGDKGEHVETLRGLLLARSHPEVKTVEGPFDATVEAAVKAVQAWGKVTADGIVGPKTWTVLLRVKEV